MQNNTESGANLTIMHFQKQDLIASHYYWKDEKKAVYNGQPSRRSFDRFDGHQVLFLINFYGSLSERFSLREGQVIELKIRDELPDDARSEIAVFNWLRTQVFSVE